MMAKTLRALKFLRLIDESNDLSLTNIAVIATLVRFMVNPTADLASLLTFALPLAGYHAKRLLSNKTATAETAAQTEEIRAAVASLQTSVTAVNVGQGRPRNAGGPR